MTKSSQNTKKIKLKLLNALGIYKKEIKNSFSIIQESKLIYFLKKNLITKDLIHKTQKYFYKENHFDNIKIIDTFVDSKNRNNVIIGQEDEKMTKITIINLLENKWNENVFVNKGKLVCLKVAYNIKTVYLLFDKEDEEQVLFGWNYFKKKLVGKILLKQKFLKIGLHPIKLKTILIMSANTLKILELKTQNKNIVEKSILRFSKNENLESFKDFCWNMTRKTYYLIVLCNNNNIILFQEEKFLKKIKMDLTINSYQIYTVDKNKKYNYEDDLFDYNQFNDGSNIPSNNVENGKIIQLVQLEEGFLIGTDNFFFCYCKIHKNKKQMDFISNNLIYVLQSFYLDFEKKKDNKLFYITANKNASLLTITTQNEKKDYNNYILKFFSLETYKSPLKKLFPVGFHQNPIINLTAARSKSLIVSLSEGEARIWSPNSDSDERNFKLLKSGVDEDIYVDVALHPFGFNLAISFFKGFKIYAILDKRLQFVKDVELVWCTIIRYSSRARYFLANEKNNVCVFDTIHYNLIFVFQGHTRLLRNFKVLDNQFSVVSYCNNGELMMWEIIDKEKISEKAETQKKEKVTVHKHREMNIYYDYVYCEKKKIFVGTNKERNLLFYGDSCKNLVLSYKCKNVEFLSLDVDNKNELLFCSTDNGCIRIFDLNKIKFSSKKNKVVSNLPYQEIKITSSKLNKIFLFENYTKVIIGEKNGTLMCFEIENLMKSNDDDNLNSLDIKNNILEITEETFFIPNYKIKEDKNTIMNLNSEIRRLKRVKSIEKKNIEKKFKNEIKLIEEKFIENLKEDKKTHEIFFKKFEEKYKEKEKEYKDSILIYENKLKKIEAKTKTLVDYESEKNLKLLERNKKFDFEKKEELEKIKEDHHIKIDKMENDLKIEFEEIDKNYIYLINKLKKYSSKFSTKINLEEKEYEIEIKNYTKILEDKLRLKKIETEKIKNENTILQKENKKFIKDDRISQNKIEKLVVENTLLLEKKVKLYLSLLKMQEQLLEKEQVILNKEDTIKSSLEIQKSIENFRYILEDKIKNFQNEKKRMMKKIKNKEHDLSNLFSELLEQSKFNTIIFNNLKIHSKLEILFKNQISFTQTKINVTISKVIQFIKQIFSIANLSTSDLDLRLKFKKKLELFISTFFDNINNENLFLENSNNFLNTNSKYDTCNNLMTETSQLRNDILKSLKNINNSKNSFKNKILIGINKNKNLIEECNKLQIENVYFIKLLSELNNTIKEAQNFKFSFIRNINFNQTKISYNNPYVKRGFKTTKLPKNK